MFIFNEDRAMHKKFTDVIVQDVNAPDTGRPVGVIWLDSDTEVTNLTFPSIVISNQGIVFDAERASAGWQRFPYTPENFPSWDVSTGTAMSPYSSQTPIPYNINYQIEVLSRSNKHSTFLSAILSGPDFLSARFGYLEIPEDGTVRRMDLEAGPVVASTRDNDGKRLFHSIYTVKVSTELLPRQIESFAKVQTVDITYFEIYPSS